jgi:hypothetical protein
MTDDYAEEGTSKYRMEAVHSTGTSLIYRTAGVTSQMIFLFAVTAAKTETLSKERD